MTTSTPLSSFKDLAAVKDLLQKREAEQPKNRFAESSKIMMGLRRRYPDVFNLDNPLPLAIGIEKEIKAACPELIVKSLKMAIAIWSKREKYLLAIIKGTHRHHLDGSVSGDIQDTEKTYSQTFLDKKAKALA